jgi:hypothetical protein
MIARLGDRKCTEQVLKGNSEFKYQEEETFVYVFKHDVLDFRIKKKKYSTITAHARAFWDVFIPTF